MGHFCFTSLLENPGKFWKNHGKIREFDSGNPVGTLMIVLNSNDSFSWIWNAVELWYICLWCMQKVPCLYHPKGTQWIILFENFNMSVCFLEIILMLCTGGATLKTGEWIAITTHEYWLHAISISWTRCTPVLYAPRKLPSEYVCLSVCSPNGSN